MLFVVVLGAVAVRQLDQAVIVRQVGVGLSETPRPQKTNEKIQGKNTLHFFTLQKSEEKGGKGREASLVFSSYWAAVPPVFSS